MAPSQLKVIEVFQEFMSKNYYLTFDFSKICTPDVIYKKHSVAGYFEFKGRRLTFNPVGKPVSNYLIRLISNFDAAQIIGSLRAPSQSMTYWSTNCPVRSISTISLKILKFLGLLCNQVLFRQG
ncbi:hypothetical protein CONCODRAFT_9153 [Conidiobolus coronatus NRRL 28638]|uniref:Uncharacterized protein n=1 Tax=Conidiobolus coronatus (strain ATCC 28846 / CBS 209.66 / NRRL 28638) TaxID=796925 RepID=A0A137P118_CONC2|nr:hypothetical protein CONCODRAFT_9153 [Conidiobolus coronatus NRRL 28638]|eukprot:KXN68559.1 hypothetical protein CONCODRAFT_9153 [Conidiobolus coronatus NRRL 28638]